MLKGKHSIKFGGEYTHLEADAQVFNSGSGRFNFLGGRIPGLTSCTSGSGTPQSCPLEDFFAGTPSNGILLGGQPLSQLTARNYAFYVQDDWRVTPRLIVNLGLRYNLLTPMKDTFGNIGNFDPSSPSGMVQQGQPGFSTIWKIDPYDFEPRIGMAWDVKGNG